MKKLLLILLCLPLIGFGQLGDYYTSDGSLKNNGLEFKLQKPNGYVQFTGQIPTTIVGFGKKDSQVLIEFYVSIYTLEQFELQNLRNASKSELKDMIVSAEDLEYYELCGYPGWIGEEGVQGYRSLQSFTLIRNNIFVIKATVRNKYIPSDVAELFYKISNTLEFTNTH
jgi:hypothetical protein